MRVTVCKTCGDLRTVVNRSHQAAPCPDCGVKRFPTDHDYSELVKKALRDHAPLPEITALDLTDDELASYNELRSEHPEAHSKTVLCWIEGRRYRPAADPYALEEKARLLEEQHAERMRGIRSGAPQPIWLTAALRREHVELDDWQRRIVDEVKRDRMTRAERIAEALPPERRDEPPRRREDGYQPETE